MGYVSQVRICMKRTAYDNLRERLITKYDYMFGKGFFELIELNEDVVVCSWEEIKWYDSFEEIRIIKDFLNELESQEIEFSFIRIGEEYSDVEIKKYVGDESCDRLYLSQYAEIF